MPSSAHLFDCSGTSVCSSVCHSNKTRDWCAAAVCSQLLAAAVCCSGLFAAACCSGLFAAACLRMRNRCTSLNRDRLMRLPSHICTSVRSLQPTHVRPSLQHMCVHRFASRIHLHNTGLGCEQRMRRAFFRSTLLALPSVHCSPRCPSIAAVHLRPSLRCADALASTGLGCDRRVCEAQLVKITGQTKNMKKTVLVQNDTLEWGATCFPRKAFRLIFGTNTVGLQYKNRTCPCTWAPALVQNKNVSYTKCYSTRRVSPKLSE